MMPHHAPTDDEIEAIVTALTDKQRVALVESRKLVDGRILVPASPVVGDLWPQPLVQYYSAQMDSLTALGLRARDHLVDGLK